MLQTNAQGSGSIEAFIITPANDLVFGTAILAPQAGSSCYLQKKYLAENWAGHPTLGCTVSGTDYDADVSPPTHTWTQSDTGLKTINLLEAWAQEWFDGGRPNNGIILLPPSFTNNHFVFVESTQALSNQPIFDATYTVAGGTNKLYEFLQSG